MRNILPPTRTAIHPKKHEAGARSPVVVNIKSESSLLGKLLSRSLSWLDATLAVLGDGFIRAWTRVERSYKRPFSRFSAWLKFAFFPLLALGALAWLAWDWTHGQSLNSAEDAIFDQVVNWRPVEPTPSGRVVVVEIDECSTEHFRAQGEGGWPWSRQRHADLRARAAASGKLDDLQGTVTMPEADQSFS